MTGPTWLLAAGLVLWLIAQPLPTTQPGGYIVAQQVTLLGWAFAILTGILVSLGTGLWGLAGWTANLWLLAVLVARRRGRVSRAHGLSWVALLCALAEVVFIYLLSGGTYWSDGSDGPVGVIHIAPRLDSVGLGTWVWLASFALIVASSWWARRRGDCRDDEAEAHEQRPQVENPEYEG